MVSPPQTKRRPVTGWEERERYVRSAVSNVMCPNSTVSEKITVSIPRLSARCSRLENTAVYSSVTGSGRYSVRRIQLSVSF